MEETYRPTPISSNCWKVLAEILIVIFGTRKVGYTRVTLCLWAIQKISIDENQKYGDVKEFHKRSCNITGVTLPSDKYAIYLQ